MNLVLRANELATTARQSHEDTIILAAETTFVRNSILDQISVLARVRRSLQNTYEWGKRDFQSLVKAMDGVDADLAGTMDMLRATQVQSVLQPSDQDGERNLLFYVDEAKVHSMREAMKQSLKDLQVSSPKSVPRHAMSLTLGRAYSNHLTGTCRGSKQTSETSEGISLIRRQQIR